MFITAYVGHINWQVYFWPILGLVLVAGLLIGLLVSGGKKYDTADNQKVGYKNYYQRKKEAEEKAAKEENK